MLLKESQILKGWMMEFRCRSNFNFRLEPVVLDKGDIESLSSIKPTSILTSSGTVIEMSNELVKDYNKQSVDFEF